MNEAIYTIKEWKVMVKRMVALEKSKSLPKGVECDWERIWDIYPEKNPAVTRAFKENFKGW